MKINYAPRGVLEIDDAKIVFRNFEGRGSSFNRPGDRNFAVVIDSRELADELIAHGWNVKIKPPKDDNFDEFMYLPVKVRADDYGLRVYLQTGGSKNEIKPEDIGLLDHVELACADMDLRPFDWDFNGKTGRTAYLKSIKCYQNVDRFADNF